MPTPLVTCQSCRAVPCRAMSCRAISCILSGPGRAASRRVPHNALRYSPNKPHRKFLQEGTDSNGDKVYTVYMQYKNTNWYPIHFGQMKAPLISYGAEGSGNTGTEVGTCTFKAFECQARVSTFYPAKCMRTCTLDYSETESTFVDLVEDECDKGAGSSLYMAGKSTATNGPSTFNVQMSDSYFYSC